MTASTARRLVGLLAIVLAIAACNRETPAPEATPEAPAAETASTEPASAEPAKIPGTDAIAAVDNAPAEAGVQAAAETVGGMERKDFAGSFGGDDIALELKADGTYAMSGAALEAPNNGSWTVEENGKRIRLDSDNKGEEDWLFAVNSSDELQALDADGNPPANAPAGSLQRVK